MLLDRLNLNQLRVFESVYRTRSTTSSADELHLTQSGVSQHLKALEESLSLVLFDRVRQRLVPTNNADTLYKASTSALHGVEEALESLLGGEKSLSGEIRVGIPIEFGNNLVLPKLSDFCREHPRVKFAFRYGFAERMNELLLNGSLDFAFVDTFTFDPAITTKPVYDEVLHLCASADYLSRKGNPRDKKENFEELDYVEYQQGMPLLKMWFGHHLSWKNPVLNVRVTAMDVQGIARLIENGVGLGILPDHVVETMKAQKKSIHVFKGCGKPLNNAISVAWLKGRTQSRASQFALDEVIKYISAR